MAISFELPIFLNGQSRDEILARMLDMLPDSLDKSEGQFPWQFLVPTATEKAEMAEFILPQAIRQTFPMWADGTMLDYHAQTRGITRKPAAYAFGYVLVSGIAGTAVPAGFQFTTAADYTQSGIPFSATGSTILGDTPVRIPVQAVNPGKGGNVSANAIFLMNTPMRGVNTSINNPEPMTGGIDPEDDEALRGRILQYDASQGAQFIGCAADYKRWAMEVRGVGSVQVQGASDDSGLVTIIALDMEGDPANEALCSDIYSHIMRPDDPEQRFAPINARLKVMPPTTVVIAVRADISLDGAASVEEIKNGLRAALKLYYKEAGPVIRYAHIGAALLQCAGVKDYDNLAVNGTSENITIAVEQIAITELCDITLIGGGSA